MTKALEDAERAITDLDKELRRYRIANIKHGVEMLHRVPSRLNKILYAFYLIRLWDQPNISQLEEYELEAFYRQIRTKVLSMQRLRRELRGEPFYDVDRITSGLEACIFIRQYISNKFH